MPTPLNRQRAWRSIARWKRVVAMTTISLALIGMIAASWTQRGSHPWYIWTVLVALAVPIWILNFQTDRHARRLDQLDAQQCPTCGYDLRATPDRCPECGTPGSPATDIL